MKQKKKKKKSEDYDQSSEQKFRLYFLTGLKIRESFTNIVLDNERAGFDATSHLILQGCKRSYITTADSTCDTYTERLKRLSKSPSTSRNPIKDKWILRGTLSMEYGKYSAEQILAMPVRPDGIFCSQ